MTTLAIDQLINDVIIPKCIKLYAYDDAYLSIDDVHLSLSGAVEKCLRYYAEDKNIQLEGNYNLNKLLHEIERNTNFPKKFIGYCHKFRAIGNSERHDITNAITKESLFILRLEFYEFITWFVNKYLKQSPIEILEYWHKEIYEKEHNIKNYIFSKNENDPILVLAQIHNEIESIKQKTHQLEKKKIEAEKININNHLFLDWQIRRNKSKLEELEIKKNLYETTYGIKIHDENNEETELNPIKEDIQLINQQQEIWDQAVQAQKEYTAIHKKRKTIDGTPEELDAYIEAHYNAWLKTDHYIKMFRGETTEPFKPVSKEEALRIVRAGFNNKN